MFSDVSRTQALTLRFLHNFAADIMQPVDRDQRVHIDYLPSQVVISLGIPPEGQKYVRVATDILLITVGTGLVLDAIQDLNNL